MLVPHTPPKPVRAVFFDIDGILLDTESIADRSIFDAFRDRLDLQVRQSLHDTLPWELKEQTIMGKHDAEVWIPRLIEYAQAHWDLQDPPTLEEFYEEQQKRYNRLCYEVKRCKGALEFVETLSKAGIPMYVTTSSTMVSVTKKRSDHNDLFRHTSFLITRESFEKEKPAPDIYLEAARRIEVHPQECLVLENTVDGCRAAREAGCGTVIAVPDHRCDKALFDGLADEVLEDLTCFDFDRYGLN